MVARLPDMVVHLPDTVARLPDTVAGLHLRDLPDMVVRHTADTPADGKQLSLLRGTLLPAAKQESQTFSIPASTPRVFSFYQTLAERSSKRLICK